MPDDSKNEVSSEERARNLRRLAKNLAAEALRISTHVPASDRADFWAEVEAEIARVKG